MKKLTAALLMLLFLLPSAACAGEWWTWDKDNTKLHVPFTLLFIADWRTTLAAERRYYRYDGWDIKNGDNRMNVYETNPILGKYPSKGRINSYFLMSYTITTLAVYALPDKWSHALQAGVILIECDHVKTNLSYNYTIQF